MKVWWPQSCCEAPHWPQWISCSSRNGIDHLLLNTLVLIFLPFLLIIGSFVTTTFAFNQLQSYLGCFPESLFKSLCQPFLLWQCKPQEESLNKHDTCTIANCLLFPFFMKCIPLWLKCNPKLHTSQYSVPYRFKPTGSNCIHGSMNCFSSETHCHNFRLSAIDSLKTLQTHTTHYTHNIYTHTSSHSHAHIYNKHVMHL